MSDHSKHLKKRIRKIEMEGRDGPVSLKFYIMQGLEQLSSIEYQTEAEADKNLIQYLEKVLEIEHPDMDLLRNVFEQSLRRANNRYAEAIELGTTKIESAVPQVQLAEQYKRLAKEAALNRHAPRVLKQASSVLKSKGHITLNEQMNETRTYNENVNKNWKTTEHRNKEHKEYHEKINRGEITLWHQNPPTNEYITPQDPVLDQEVLSAAEAYLESQNENSIYFITRNQNGVYRLKEFTHLVERPRVNTIDLNQILFYAKAYRERMVPDLSQAEISPEAEPLQLDEFSIIARVRRAIDTFKITPTKGYDDKGPLKPRILDAIDGIATFEEDQHEENLMKLVNALLEHEHPDAVKMHDFLEGLKEDIAEEYRIQNEILLDKRDSPRPSHR